VDPWILGAWLGDGHSLQPAITSIDDEVVETFRVFASSLGLRVTQSGISYFLVGAKGILNPFTAALRGLGVWGEKHVPELYVHNSREVRLGLLAGILDTDGHLDAGTNYDFVQKNERTFDGVREIAHSLGLTMTKSLESKSCMYLGEKRTGQYFRGLIAGAAELLAEIPVKIPRKKFVMRKKARFDLITFKLVPTV
jgi:replicative DNA helicase